MLLRILRTGAETQYTSPLLHIPLLEQSDWQDSSLPQFTHQGNGVDVQPAYISGLLGGSNDM